VKKKVIMVTGVQRSGTTALFRSLARDPAVTAFHENADDAVYYLYRLRPMREVAPILNAAPGAVLLKPINETFDRSLEDLRAEYASYALQLVWIYRDPVNVLTSMSRKGWLPTDLAGESGAGSWVARNRLALQFQKNHPTMIAVVRYEDLIADPNVFRSLCESLGVKGTPVFRQDRGTGRRDLPLANQRSIDAVTRTTLTALDVARTFRPGPLCRLKSAAAAGLARLPSKRRPSTVALAPPEVWTEGVAGAEPMAPSQLNDLLFWLDPERLNPIEGRIREIEENGPFQFRALADSQPPFCIPFLHGRRALFFPTSKASERLNGDRGLLRFVASTKGPFRLIVKSFSGLALIKPHIPVKTHHDQQRVVALHLRSQNERVAFSLEWDRALAASRVLLRTQDECGSFASVPGSHPHQQWRMIYFQFGSDAHFVISANGIASAAPVTPSAISSDLESEWTIELGGSENDPTALFYGAIAEIALFARALTASEQFALTKYLKEKYRL